MVQTVDIEVCRFDLSKLTALNVCGFDWSNETPFYSASLEVTVCSSVVFWSLQCADVKSSDLIL